MSAMKHLLLLAGAAALASAAPAFAKPKHAGHHGKHMNPVAQGYGAGHCPPGLAKKGCMPPGQAKKLYNIGQRLPYGFNGYTPYNQIPYDLRRHYGLDDDYRYIYRDQYLYQVDPTTYAVRRILDAIL